MNFFYRLVLLFVLLLGCLAAQCGNQAQCRVKLAKRTQDTHYVPPEPSPVVVLALDTAPTLASAIFEAELKAMGYEYYLLGSTAEAPQPDQNGLFKLALWNYRFRRYQSVVERIAADDPTKIIVLSDANDVILAAGPAEVAQKFIKQGKRILLSGTMYCCNVRIIEYFEKSANDLGIVNIRSENPEIKSVVSSLWGTLVFNGPAFGFEDAPALLWTPSAKEELAGIKAIGNDEGGVVTKNRYVNAGGIAGYAADMAVAMREIDPKPFDDDEQQWALWLGRTGHPSGRGGIDYRQSIFAVVDQLEGRDAELRILFDDFLNLPVSKFFDFAYDEQEGRYVNTFGEAPVSFHCAGCGETKMKDMRQRLLEKMPFLEPWLSEELKAFADNC